jgi:hypothetical protein
MFGLKPKLPITYESQEWVDRSFVRLASLLGADRMLEDDVILPTPEHFPDRYDGSEESLGHMVVRIAAAMQVDPRSFDVELFQSDYELSSTLIPFWHGSDSAAAGLYFHTPEERQTIAVNAAELKDPMALVAVIAHEIGHIILLRPGLIQRDEQDMEPLNDLLAIFLGFGIFTANAAFHFSQFADNQSQGWSTKRRGYLPEPMLGYALARYAYERGEDKPSWGTYVAGNISPYMKQSLGWLIANKAARLFP